jgi:hypothetical protein
MHPVGGAIEQQIAHRAACMEWRRWVRSVEVLHTRRRMANAWRWLYL